MIVNNTLHHLPTQKPIPDVQHSVNDLIRKLELPALPIETFDERRFNVIVDQFLVRLYLLRIGGQTPETLTEEEILSFTRYLVDNQNTNKADVRAYGSWSLLRFKALPLDIAYDYAFRPSQIAVSWLVLLSTRYPSISEKVNGVEDALKAAFRFLSRGRLTGPGYEALRGLVTSVNILSMGSVITYVNSSESKLYGFKEQLAKARNTLQVTANPGCWDQASSLDKSRALNLLNGADVDDAVVCPVIWHTVMSRQQDITVRRILNCIPKRVAKKLEDIIVEAVEGCIDQIAVAYRMEVPEYVVFKTRRRVRSKPIIIDRYFDLMPIVMDELASFDLPSWAGIISEDQILKEYGTHFWSKVSRHINELISKRDPIKDQEFNVRVRSITDHLPDGFMIDLVAEG